MDKIFLAVNGSLMRGLALNQNLVDARAQFVQEIKTSPNYRLWSIDDSYPAMLRDEGEGTQIDVEIWEIPLEGLVEVLKKEPPGLCLGKIELQDNKWEFGILGEPYICEGCEEISHWGGWRSFWTNKYG
jgi:hypothetical protein